MDRSDHDAGVAGALLRRHRQAAGLSQRELASRAGFSVGMIRDLEQGRTRRPRPGALAALAGALGLSQADAGELAAASAAPGLRLQVLGPLAAWRDGTSVQLGGPGQRAVLGVLALAAGSLVHRTAIIDVLWPDDPPASAANLVQVHVSRLRRVLDPGRGAPGTGGGGAALVSAGTSYQLRAESAQLDLLAFGQLVSAARAAGSTRDHEAACALYQQAAELWHGEPLADVDLLREYPAVAGLSRRRAEMVIEYARAAAAAGSHERVLGLLRELAAREPLNERAHAQLMIALAGTGHQAAALAVYHEVRRRLDEELGMRPGRDLAEAHQLVLGQGVQVARSSVVAATATAAENARGGPGLIPRQLPGTPDHFVGRAGELAVLDAMLGQPRDEALGTVVISAIGGTAGVGKTALAVRWAHQVARHFPDGQLYVNLRGFSLSGAPATPDEAIREFLNALGVPADRIPPGLAAQAGLFRSLLAGRRTLIVLDNARDEQQVRPLLPGSAGCLVIVTSRSELSGLAVTEGARLLALDVLSHAEARQMLTARLGAARAAAEPDVVSEIAELCARLPLALAVAAARAATRPSLPLADLAARLRDAASRLDFLDTGDPAASVRAVFSWSAEQLPGPAARLFGLLGLHPGPDITAAAAASLAGLPLARVRRHLAELTRAHLVAEPVPGRYASHDLLRVFAAEQVHATMSDGDRRAAMHRMLDHYLHTGHAAALLLTPLRDQIRMDPPRPGVMPGQLSDEQQALDWFQAESRVLFAVITLAAAAGFDTCAWQLPWTMSDFLDRRGLWREWEGIQRSALAAATRLGDVAAQALARRTIARACARMADYDEAYAQLAECLGLHRELGDHVGEARVEQTLGWVAHRRNDYPDALLHTERSLAMNRASGDRGGEACDLNSLGWLHSQLGHYEQARPFCQEALALHSQTGDRYGEAHTWDSLGYLEHQLGRLAEAAECYRRCLRLFQELGDRYYESSSLLRLADTLSAAGEPDRARDVLRRALNILLDLSHPEADDARAKLATLDGV